MEPRPAQPSERPTNPYVGPRPFAEDDESRFFGRDREASDVFSLVVAHRAVLLYAQSGAGKSSLVRARIVPALRRRGYEILPITRVSGGPGRTAARNVYLSNAVEYWGVAGAVGLRQALERLPVSKDPRGEAAPRVVIFDQFEEIFTAYPERFAEREEFLEELRGVIDDNIIARALFVMREDYLASLSPYEDLFPEELRTRYRLERLQKEAALIAVQAPARAAGVDFEAGVAEELVSDLMRTPRGTVDFVEPVQLQVVCYTLFDRLPARPTSITREQLRSFGDVDQALQTYYVSGLGRAVTAGASEDQLRAWFDMKLIIEGQTRGMSFRGATHTDGVPNAAVDALANQHLIAEEIRPDGTLWYELSHDRFIEPIRKANESWRARRLAWHALRQWVGAGALVAATLIFALLAWLLVLQRRETDSQRRERAIMAREAETRGREAETRGREAEQARRATAAEHVARTALEDAADARQRELLAERQRSDLERQRSSEQREVLNALASAHVATRPDLAALISLEALREHSANVEARSNLLAALQSLPRLVMYLRDHTGEVNRAVFSPDGSLIASASNDGSIVLWHADSGRPVRKPLVGHTGEIRDVEFSRDGRRLASAGTDMTVRLWDADSGRPLGNPLRGHESWVKSVAFNADGKRLASGSSDRTIRLWDVDTGAPDPLALRGHTDEVTSVAFSPDGQTLASSSRDGTVRLWDVKLHRELRPPIRDHSGPVWKVVFSPDGSLLASCGGDRTIRIWSTDGYRPVGRPIAAHADTITSLAFSPDGRVLASAAADKVVRLWNVADGTPIGSPLSGHSEPILSVDFSANGSRLATAGIDKTVVLWDLGMRERVSSDWWTAPTTSWAVAYSPNGRVIATGGDDGNVGLWDATTRQRLGVPLEGRAGGVAAVAFSPDSALLASCSTELRLWDVATGHPVGEPLRGHTKVISAVAFSPDGTLLASAGAEGTVRLWNVATRQTVAELKGSTAAIHALAFSADSQILASGDAGGAVRTWDVKSRQEVLPALAGHSGVVRAVAFVNNSSLLISAGTDKKMVAWDLGSRAAPGRKLLELDREIYSLAVSADGRTVFAGTSRGIRRIDIATGKDVGPDLTDHSGAVLSLALNRTGALASAGSDGSVIVWNLATGHSDGLPIRGHFNQVYSVAFHPREDRMAFGGSGGDVLVADLTNRNSVLMQMKYQSINRLAFSGDGSQLAGAGCATWKDTACTDGAIQIWDPVKGAQIREPLAVQGSEVRSVVFHPQRPVIIAGTANGDVGFWDVRTGRLLAPAVHAHTGPVHAVAVTPDGRMFATGGNDMKIRLWNTDARTEIGSPLVGHQNELRGLAFSRDGKLLASSARDRTIIMWDVSKPLKPRSLHTLQGHDGSVQSVAFTPDSTTLVSASVDSTVRLWDVATGKPIGTLRGHSSDVESVAVNRTGTLAASGGRDGVVSAWDLSIESWRARACQMVERNLDRSEWAQYFRGRQPRPVCPEVSVREADALALRGEKDEAARTFAEAVREAREKRNPELMNEICWYGALDDMQAVVWPACNATMELASPEDRGFYADSRGVAAALRGDYARAQADFELFLAWSQNHASTDESMRRRRREWINELKAGRNPITPSVIDSLRTETASLR